MSLRKSPFLAPAFASLALAACGASDNASSHADQHAAACAGDGVAVSEAWARSSRAGQPTSAAYMSLCSAEGDALVSATFNGANATELHLTTMSEDGTASMSQTSQIALPAGEPVSLKPGGAHIMMIGLEEALAAGDATTITLEFEKAGAVDVALEVREATSGGHH